MGWTLLTYIVVSFAISVVVEAIGGWVAFAFDVILAVANFATMAAGEPTWLIGAAETNPGSMAALMDMFYSIVAALPTWAKIGLTVADVYMLWLDYYMLQGMSFTAADAQVWSDVSQIAGTVASGVASTVGAVLAGTATGLISSLSNSGLLGWVLVGVGAYLLYRYVSKEDEPTTIIDQTPQLTPQHT